MVVAVGLAHDREPGRGDVGLALAVLLVHAAPVDLAAGGFVLLGLVLVVPEAGGVQEAGVAELVLDELGLLATRHRLGCKNDESVVQSVYLRFRTSI